MQALLAKYLNALLADGEYLGVQAFEETTLSQSSQSSPRYFSRPRY
jgi:hypothetical protein